MIPMLRTLASALSAAATSGPYFCLVVVLPAIVSEGLVGLRHLVGVLAPLDGGTEAIARVEQLVHQPLNHRLLAPCPGVLHKPAQAQSGLPGRAHLDRHLVR